MGFLSKSFLWKLFLEFCAFFSPDFVCERSWGFVFLDGAGNEGHGVYVCRKCGWPFPNPHPSARHRRAHKRICGTVEGYTLVDSEETVSDDEHLSDEDHKLPSENSCFYMDINMYTFSFCFVCSV
jgi:hypothetical protein